MNKYGYLDQLKVEDVLSFERHMHSVFELEHESILERLRESYTFDDALIADIKVVMDDLVRGYHG